jgi:hypothetical protein
MNCSQKKIAHSSKEITMDKTKKTMPYKPSSRKPEAEVMPYKPSTRGPKAEVMPYKPSNRGGTSAGPVPSEISKGETRRAGSSSTNDKTSRTMSMAKKAAAKPATKKAAPKPAAKATPKTTTKAPAKMTPKPKTTKKPEKMTPQDAAMKKLLEKKYGKIYG